MLVSFFISCISLAVSYFLESVQFLSFSFGDMQFAKNLSIHSIHPDFLLLFLFFFILYKTPLSAIWLGFLIGILEDGQNWFFNDGNPESYSIILGTHTLVYSLFAYIISRLREFILKMQAKYFAFSIFVSIALIRLFVYLLHAFTQGDFGGHYSVLLDSLYTVILMPFYFLILNWLYSFTRKEGTVP